MGDGQARLRTTTHEHTRLNADLSRRVNEKKAECGGQTLKEALSGALVKEMKKIHENTVQVPMRASARISVPVRAHACVCVPMRARAY
jgi:hypothetical protein